MSQKLRKNFLVIMGETYEEYGYPNFCGWVEGLLLLEAREWTQRDISLRLRELFPESKYPTSIPSVNRAVKTLEDYGVIERSGSRKIGYQYRLSSSSNLLVSMFQRLMTVNQNFMTKMRSLMTQNTEGDPELKRAVQYQVDGAELWKKIVEELLQSISKGGEIEKKEKGEGKHGSLT